MTTSDGKDYLHANYVDGYREEKRYILTQAPLEATFERFWEMVWKENSTMIIALTPLDGEKCPIYLPIGSGQSKEYGKIKVVNMGTRHIRDTYDATLLMITKDGAPIRTILHLIFFSWPDKETPIRPTEIIHFIDDINFNRNILMKTAQNKGWLTNASTSKSPIIIHCKAGVGRSAWQSCGGCSGYCTSTSNST
uniref:protein-tyrosine-phosphatase n=1 Tax=Panagrolaimus superbus TaxID=310955 RepID=A0A914Y039_9BILA